MKRITYIRLLILVLITLWLPPLRCQHLMGVPNFCAGGLCLSSDPVVSRSMIGYPSFSFSKGKKSNGYVSVYIIEYKDIGHVGLSMSTSTLAACADINERAKRSEKINDRSLYNKKLCAVSNGKTYLLEISLHGLSITKTRDLCNQALDGVWVFDSFLISQSEYKPTYTKIDFNLDCQK